MANIISCWCWVYAIREWDGAGVRLRFGWVKAHVGIEGNEVADEMAKEGCLGADPPVVTEGGIRAMWKCLRAVERSVVGFGMGSPCGE